MRYQLPAIVFLVKGEGLELSEPTAGLEGRVGKRPLQELHDWCPTLAAGMCKWLADMLKTWSVRSGRNVFAPACWKSSSKDKSIDFVAEVAGGVTACICRAISLFFCIYP